MAFSLDSDLPPQTGTLKLDGPETPLAPSDEIVKQRAMKAEFGLNAPYQDVWTAITNGNEQPWRKNQAAIKDQQKLDEHAGMVADVLRESPDAAILAKDQVKLSQILGTPAPVDPRSVLEDYYTGSYLRPMYNVSDAWTPGTFMDDYLNRYKDSKEEVDHVYNFMSQRQYAITKSQDAETAYKQQGWIPWAIRGGVDLMLGIPQEVAERTATGGFATGQFGAEPGSSTWSMFGRASALEQEAKWIHEAPTQEEFKNRFDSAYNYLKAINPLYAKDLSDALAGKSLNQMDLENQMTWVSVPQDFAMITGSKAVQNTVPALTRRQVQTATTQMVRTAIDLEKPNVSPEATQRAGIGDLKEAAIQQNAFDENKNVPLLDRLANRLPTAYKTLADNLRSNPGNTGAEFANRIAQRITALGDQVEAARRTMQVNRVPALDTSQALQKMVSDEVMQKYGGPNSGVFNVSGPIHSSELPEGTVKGAGGSNTYWHAVRAGDHDGLMFKDTERAREFAETYGYQIHEPRQTNRAHWDAKVSEQEKRVQAAEEQLKDHSGSEFNEQRGESWKQQKAANDFERVDIGNELKRRATEAGGVEKARESSLDFRNLEARLKTLKDEQFHIETNNPRFTPSMHADVRGLNIWNALNDKVKKLRTDLHDMRKVRDDAYVTTDYDRPSTDGWMLKQWGAGYYWERYVPTPENGVVMQKLIELNPDARTPLGKTPFGKKQFVQDIQPDNKGMPGKEVSWWTNWTSFLDNPSYLNKHHGLSTGFRSAAETFSKAEKAERETSVHSANNLLAAIKRNDKISKSPKVGEGFALADTLKMNQQMPDPLRPGEFGQYFQNIAELENHFKTKYGYFPHQKTVAAYFAHVANLEFDRTLRMWAVGRNMWINGVEAHTIQRVVDNKELNSLPIHGSLQKDLPTGDKQLYINWEGKKITEAFRLGDKNWSALNEEIKQGRMKILKIWNTEDRDWHVFDPDIAQGAKIEYVISPTVTSRNVDLNAMVPRRQGGHWIYQYPVYGKQANMVKDPHTNLWHYEGDTTAMAFASRRTARRWTDHMNKLNEYFKNNDIEGARSFHGGKFGMDFDTDIHQHYFPKKGPDGRMMPPRYNFNEPFLPVSKGKSVLDIDKSVENRYVDPTGRSTFRDGTTSGNPARMAQVEFTGQRDAYNLHTIEDKGTERNPIYMYRPADMMSPVDSMNRAITRIVNTSYLDDYKYMAVKHWIQAASPWLDHKDGLLEASPFKFFQQHDWKSDAPLAVVRSLEANKVKVRQIIGETHSITATVHDSVSNFMYDMLYKAGANKLPYISLDQVGTSRNPVQAFRSLVVHAKLGWPAQFFMQMFTAANVYAIKPQYALQATAASLLHTYARIMPQHIDYLDTIASRAGFRPGEFKTAWKGFQDSGFFNVGAEHPILSGGVGIDSGKAFGVGSKILMTPFYEGAQATRAVAWYTSFLEHAHEKGIKNFGRPEWKMVLSRASDMDHNMNRSANSSINTGLMSYPSMFQNYSRNLSELFFGKRLTPAEKSRLFFGNMLLWGAPSSTGLLGLPLTDWLHEQVLKAGYFPGDNLPITMWMEGFPSMVNAYITGKGDWTDVHKRLKTGTWYNWSKFGPESWEPINEILGDDDKLKLIGAPYTVMKNTWERTKPLWYWATSQIYGTPGDQYPLNLTDITNLLKEFQAYSVPQRTLIAARTHVLVSANNRFVESGITANDAYWRALMGLTDSRVASSQAQHEVTQERVKFTHHIEQMYEQAMNQALLYGDMDKDYGPNSRYANYKEQARFLLRLPELNEKDTNDIVRRYGNNHQTLLEKMAHDRFNSHVPRGEVIEQQQRAKRYQDLEDQKVQ